MQEPSRLVSFVFVAIVLVVVALFVLGLRSTEHGDARPRRSTIAIAIAVLAWYLVIPGALARARLLDRYDPLPAPALVLIGAITVATIGLAFTSLGKRLAPGLPLTALVGFQVFRVPVEWTLHRLYVEGVVPVQMTYSGRNFDVVTGIAAGVLALWLAGGRKAPRLVFAWNLLGLVLLANIVVIAVLSTPVSFRLFTESAPQRLPSTFPFVWLPSFLVQAALFGHLIVFRRLRARAEG
jgi:hypothetical protein